VADDLEFGGPDKEVQRLVRVNLKPLTDKVTALAAENVRLRAAVAEAADWVCSHTEARAHHEVAADRRRFWCCDCSSWIHDLHEATLQDRLRQLSADSSGVQAGTGGAK
jgi:hypothetical protein